MKESMDAGLAVEIESFVENLVGEGVLRLEEGGRYTYSAPDDLGDNFARIYGNFAEGELGIEVFAPSGAFNVAVIADKTGFRAGIYVKKGEETNSTLLSFEDQKVYVYGNEKVELASELKDSVWHVNSASLQQIDILPDDTKKVGDTLRERLDYVEQMALTLKDTQNPRRN